MLNNLPHNIKYHKDKIESWITYAALKNIEHDAIKEKDKIVLWFCSPQKELYIEIEFLLKQNGKIHYELCKYIPSPPSDTYNTIAINKTYDIDGAISTIHSYISLL